MFHRWSFRLPLWAAIVIVAAVYVVRSAMRGFDFRPDLPGDAVVLGLFVIVLGIVAYVRTAYGDHGASSPSEAEDSLGDADGSSGEPRD